MNCAKCGIPIFNARCACFWGPTITPLPEPERDREESSPCSAWVDAAALEKAWREGYASGYYNGTNDTARYECGGGSNKAARRDEDDEWNGSETKASTDQAERRAEPVKTEPKN